MVMLCKIILLLFEVLVFVCILAKLSIDMFVCESMHCLSLVVYVVMRCNCP